MRLPKRGGPGAQRRAAAAHALDESRAPGPVDAAEAQRHRGEAARREHGLGFEHARAAKVARRGGARLVHPRAVVLRVDRRARREEDARRCRSARVQRRDEIAQAVDVGAAVRSVVAAVGGGGVDRRRREALERASAAASEFASARSAASGVTPSGRPVGPALQSEDVVSRVAQQERRAPFRRSHSRRRGNSAPSRAAPSGGVARSRRIPTLPWMKRPPCALATESRDATSATSPSVPGVAHAAERDALDAIALASSCVGQRGGHLGAR